MRPTALYVTFSAGILTLVIVVFLSAQTFPQFKDKLLDPLGDSRPSSASPTARPPVKSEPGYDHRPGEKAEGSPTEQEWAFDHKRDGNNHGLTEAQCLSAFPQLYKEVDRAVHYHRNERGKITQEDVEIAWRHDGIVRVLIDDNHLHIVDALKVFERGHRFRHMSTLLSLQAAVSGSQEPLPNTELTYTILDFPLRDSDTHGHTTLAYSREPDQKSLWLMPDFGFYSWPKINMNSYSDLRAVIEENEDDFLDKIPKLIWRGQVDRGKEVRQALLDASEGQPWSAVSSFSWHNQSDVDANLISMEDHCDYMFAAMTEGLTWSGRLKYLLNCHSILVSHELHFIEFYHHLLESEGSTQNYVKLDRSFSDLRSTMEHLLEPANLYTDSRLIADNARRTFRERYLTPAAISCYWRALIRGWASVQDFEPQLWLDSDNDQQAISTGQKPKRRPRGVPYEAYMIMEALEWEVPAGSRKLVNNEDE